MPSKTNRQHNFAAMSAKPDGRHALAANGRKPMPKAVAKEFLKADKGKSAKSREK